MQAGHKTYIRYGAALLASAAAFGVRLLLNPALGDRTPYATFYVSVAFSAAFGGLGPAVFACLLGAFGAATFFVRPHNLLAIEGIDFQIGFVLYLIVSGILIAFARLQRNAQAASERAVRSAEEERARWHREALLRQDAELAERFRREQFETTLESITEGIIATGPDACVKFLNTTASVLTGWPLTAAIGQPLSAVFNAQPINRCSASETPADVIIQPGLPGNLARESALFSRDGSSRIVDIAAFPTPDAIGKAVDSVLVFRDRTAEIQRELENQQLNRMIELSHDAIIVTDASRRIRSWNWGAREMYGWEASEATGQVIHELLKTRSATPTENIDVVLEEDGRWDGELVHLCRDGHEVVSESRQILIRDPNGRRTGILEVNRDATRRKRAEEELRRAADEAEKGRRTLDALLEHIPEGIAIASAPDARVRLISAYGVELMGLPRSALLDRPKEDHPLAGRIWHEDGKTIAVPEELPLTRAVTRGQVIQNEEWIYKRADGAIIPILCTAAPIKDHRGEVTGGLIAWRDISQRKQLEEGARQAANLETLATLAGGIAHRFNNLLTGVLGNCSLLLDEEPLSSNARRWAEAITTAAEDAARLAQQMLAYSGRGRFVDQPVNLSDYVRDLVPVLQNAIPGHVQLKVALADRIPIVQADVSQLQQVIINLVMNGAEAICPEGGRLEIVTAVQDVDKTYIETLASKDAIPPGQYVMLEVRDTGCGMDEATAARVFEPFFTTKFTGRGLGLAAVQGIVRGHGGAIKVYSAPGVGTTVRVLLPASTPGGSRADALASFRGFRGSGTAMVIDDEEVIRTTARDALQQLGFNVVVAANGHEAIQLFRRHSGWISIVILDMTMPSCRGEEVLAELRKIRTDVPVVLSTGFSEAEVMQRFGDKRLAGVLLKPYTLRTLFEKIKSATTCVTQAAT